MIMSISEFQAHLASLAFLMVVPHFSLSSCLLNTSTYFHYLLLTNQLFERQNNSIYKHNLSSLNFTLFIYLLLQNIANSKINRFANIQNIMINTPKKDILRFSFTRSLPRIRELSQKQESKTIHNSLHKNDRINYHTILNKLLSLQNYKKFMQLACKFVDRSVLQCKQQPTRVSALKDLNANLINDGLFIHKLAQLSENPADVLNHFKNYVKINKQPIRQLAKKIQRQKGQRRWELQQQNLNQQDCNSNYQTQQDRQRRLNGYYKSNNDNDMKENKIIYSEFIKSNRKSMEIYQKMKQKLEIQNYLQKKQGEVEQKIKRSSFNQDRRIEMKVIQKIDEFSLAKLTEVQRQILKCYPSLKYIAHLGSVIKEWKLVQELGNYKGYRVFKVAIQLQQGFQQNLNEVNSKSKYDFVTFEHAILISNLQKEQTLGQNQNKGTNLVIDQFVRIYLNK